MHLIQLQSPFDAVDSVVTAIIDLVESKPHAVIGLATGRTMEPVYAKLAKYKNKNTSFMKECFFFMLDEYLDIPEDHPSSFRSYIIKNFTHPLNLKLSQFAFPPVTLSDGANLYEQLLKESGGVDLQLLGLGRNGHVGFNEPGSMKNSRTRIVKLTSETIEANRDQFMDIIPSRALSMGIGTILESKKLLMLVTGKSKADAIKNLVRHQDDLSCPVTLLKDHPHFTLVLDPEASSKINLNI